MGDADRRVAVVIPSYRVKQHILNVLDGIGEEVANVYVVDDKCPEKSGQFVLDNCRDRRVTVLFHEENQGVGGAVITGYRRATQEGADGDGQMDPALIGNFVQPILEGRADYTKGNRFYNVEDVRTMPFPRLIGNALLSFMTKLSSGYWDIFDPTNGFTRCCDPSSCAADPGLGPEHHAKQKEKRAEY
jgi:dolichol-phosphate mannosyltransferase